jgi:hypothetical protein
LRLLCRLLLQRAASQMDDWSEAPTRICRSNIVHGLTKPNESGLKSKHSAVSAGPAMAVVDQKESYRRAAELCYQIAGRMPAAQAISIVRLGDSYAALTCTTSQSPREGDASRTPRYIAVSFRRVWNNGFAPGPAIECPDATLAIRRAELMAREEHIAGAVAFSRSADPVGKKVGVAVILKSFGDIPEDFDIA